MKSLSKTEKSLSKTGSSTHRKTSKSIKHNSKRKSSKIRNPDLMRILERSLIASASAPDVHRTSAPAPAPTPTPTLDIDVSAPAPAPTLDIDVSAPAPSLTIDISPSPAHAPSLALTGLEIDTDFSDDNDITVDNYLKTRKWPNSLKKLFKTNFSIVTKISGETGKVSKSIIKNRVIQGEAVEILSDPRIRNHKGLCDKYPEFTLPKTTLRLVSNTTNNKKYVQKIFDLIPNNMQQLLYVVKEFTMQQYARTLLKQKFNDLFLPLLEKRMLSKVIIPKPSALTYVMNDDETDKLYFEMEYLEKATISNNEKKTLYEDWVPIIRYIFDFLKTKHLFHNDTAIRNVYFTRLNRKLTLAIIDFGETEVNLKADSSDKQFDGFRYADWVNDFEEEEKVKQDKEWFKAWLDGKVKNNEWWYKYYGGLQKKMRNCSKKITNRK